MANFTLFEPYLRKLMGLESTCPSEVGRE